MANIHRTMNTATNSLFLLASDEPSRNLKLTVSRRALQNELDLLTEVVEGKTAIPLLQHLLLEASTERVRLRAIGVYNTLQCDVEADVQPGGRLCLPAKKLADIVHHLPAATIHLTSNGGTATLQCGDSRFKLKTLVADDFPAIETSTEAIATIPSEILVTLLRSVLFATAKTTDSGRYALEGAQLTIGPAGVRIIATNGHRMISIERADVTCDETLTLLIPRHSLQVITKIFGAQTSEVSISRDDNHLFFRQGTRLLACTLLDGIFPDCEPILSQEFHHELTLEGAMFQAAIQRMSVFGTEGNGQAFGVIKFHFAPDSSAGGYEVQSFDPSGGEGREEIVPLTADAQQAVTISFNGRYLLEFARAITASSITIKYSDEKSCVEIRPVTEDGCKVRYILMPCLV